MQNTMMKTLPLAGLVILLTACSTIQGLQDGAQGGLLSLFSTKYALPTAYETAYSYRTGTPDEDIQNIPKSINAHRAVNPNEYIRAAAAFIQDNAKNDFEKVKKAHDAVTLSIQFDAANFWAGTVPDQNYHSVLQSGFAVSDGYANTFKKLCDALKIPCKVVRGFGRGFGTSLSAGDTPNTANHAWNIVRINGENYLVDCTWDAGFLDGTTAKQQYSTDWLFLKPEHFLYTHYPKNAKQQLIETPLTAAEFSALPFLKPRFFEAAADLSIDLKKINQVDNTLSFNYTARNDYWLTFNITDIKNRKPIQNRDFVQIDGAKSTAFFSFPAAGHYSVTVFWWKPGAAQGEGCGEFIVEASSASTVQYPTLFTSSAANLQIISPVEMPLKAGETYTFSVHMDNKNMVSILYDNATTPLTEKSGGIFSADFTVPNNITELSLGITGAERGRYEIIAKYTVQQP